MTTTPIITQRALRNMADPAEMGDYDNYPDRYTGTSDNGGVHSNSGIANLAFVLLVEGGIHPRGKNVDVVVPGIGFEAAAIFYAANTACLTPAATFAEARYCTADVHGGANADAVNAAWAAVGVSSDYSPPPPPAAPIELSSGVTETGLAVDTGSYQRYTLAVVDAGYTVSCKTSCNNGDADLYLRFGAEPDLNPTSTNNDCVAYTATSNESCTTASVSTEAITLYATVHAYGAFTDLAVTCTSVADTGGTCDLGQPGDSCTTGNDCCSSNCKGKPGSKTCK